jgi:hypothetical protein
MYHRRFEYMRYAKGLGPGLSLCASGARPRDLGPLVRDARLDDEDADVRLREAIGNRHGVAAERVVLTVGASEANAVVALAFVRPGDEVVVERPAYEGLPGLCQWLGATVRRVERRPERAFALDLDEVAAAIGERTRLVMLTHPHNPSGRPLTLAEITRLRALSTARGVPILVDEIYRDDLADPPPVAAAGEGLVITTSSLTKVYGLGALRAGWIIAPGDIAARLDEILDWLHVVPPQPSVALALAAWPHLDAWRRAEQETITAARAVLDEWRARTGLLPGPITGGMPFYCAALPEADDRAFCARLAARGLSVPAGSFFEAPGTARIGFGRLPPERLRAALAVIAE